MIAFKLKLLMNKTHKKKTKKKNPEKRTPQWLTKPPKLLSSNRIPIMANRDYRTKNPIEIYSEMIKNKPYDFEFLIRKIFQREIPQIYEYYLASYLALHLQYDRT